MSDLKSKLITSQNKPIYDTNPEKAELDILVHFYNSEHVLSRKENASAEQRVILKQLLIDTQPYVNKIINRMTFLFDNYNCVYEDKEYFEKIIDFIDKFHKTCNEF